MRPPLLKKSRLSWIVLVLYLCGCSPQPDKQQAYPSRPIEVIVPFAPGGGSDTFARLIKAAMAENDLLPHPLVIINAAGAGGTIGSRRVLNSRPDGYTVLLLHDAIFTAKRYGVALYGPESFEHVAATGRAGMVLAVNENSEFDSLGGLLKAAADDADTVSFAANLGAPSHFLGLIVQQKFNANQEHRKVQFRFAQSGGGADRFASIKGGHADATVFSLDEYLRFQPDGIRAIAFFGEERTDRAPEIPTAMEQGVDVTFSNMQYWWMPKGTPSDRVSRFTLALRDAMQSPELRLKLDAMKIDPVMLTDQRLTEHLNHRDEILKKVDPGTRSPLPNFHLVLLASSLALGSLLFRERRTKCTMGERQKPPVREWRILGVCGLFLVAYSVGIIIFDLPLGITTFVFVLAAGILISLGKTKRFDGRVTGQIAATALIVGTTFHLVFTRMFEIGLR